MKKITSSDNQYYKLCTKLALKKYRDKTGLYLIEGENLLVEAGRSNVVIEHILLREGVSFQIETGWPEPLVLPSQLFERAAQTETSQGILAIAARKQWTREEFFRHAAGKNVLVLDRVQDPGNIGTMIRTAEAASYAGVIVLKGTGDLYAPKVVRAAAGSLFRLPVLYIDEPEEALDLLKSNGKQTVSACFDTDLYYYDVDMRQEIGLLIGNEGNGLCEVLLGGADYKVKIPMAMPVDSLNASVAAGIFMFESRRP